MTNENVRRVRRADGREVPPIHDEPIGIDFFNCYFMMYLSWNLVSVILAATLLFFLYQSPQWWTDFGISYPECVGDMGFISWLFILLALTCFVLAIVVSVVLLKWFRNRNVGPNGDNLVIQRVVLRR